MSENIFFGKNDFRYLFYRFKDSGFYLVGVISLVILVCLILAVTIIIPQTIKYFSIRDEVVAQREKIRIINENIDFMRNINNEKLESQLRFSTRALPSEKDFNGILFSLADSTIKSGVSLEDFSFKIGEIASKSAAQGITSKTTSNSIDMAISVSGSASNIQSFLRELNQKFPLSEVYEIDSVSNSTMIELRFYYSPYPEIAFRPDVPITDLSESKKKALEDLSSWDVQPIGNEIAAPVGSSSAAPLFD